jgi:hypothetical protein
MSIPALLANGTNYNSSITNESSKQSIIGIYRTSERFSTVLRKTFGKY